MGIKVAPSNSHLSSIQQPGVTCELIYFPMNQLQRHLPVSSSCWEEKEIKIPASCMQLLFGRGNHLSLSEVPANAFRQFHSFCKARLLSEMGSKRPTLPAVPQASWIVLGENVSCWIHWSKKRCHIMQGVAKTPALSMSMTFLLRAVSVMPLSQESNLGPDVSTTISTTNFYSSSHFFRESP